MLATVAVMLVTAGAAAIAPAQAASLFSDGFESGTMSAWSTVTAAAGGVVGVQSATVKSGTKAAQLSETTGAGSIAYARTALSGDQTDLTATGAFMVTTEGASNANVPFFRFLDATGARAISLYRQNASGNHIWLKIGSGSAAQTTGLLPLSTWGVLSLHTVVAGTTSTVSVSLNGSTIYTTNAATLNSPMRTVQIGNDTASQVFGIFVDDVQLNSGGTSGDTTAPDTTITSPAPSGTTSSASFSFTSNEAGSTFQCSMDGSTFATCSSPASYTGLTNGSHTFAVRAIDPAANTGVATTSTWTVNAPDTTPPDTTIDSGPTGTVTTPDASFTFSSTESGSSFACKLDTAAFAPCTSPASYTGLSNAPHTFSVQATDSASNPDPTPATRTWTVGVPTGDTTPPDTTITGGPANNTTSPTASGSFTFTSSEPTNATFTCTLDGTSSSCTSPAPYNLTDGSHTFSVAAKDAAGNTDPTPDTRTWTVSVPPKDTTAPDTTISAGPSDPSTTANATFTFASTEGGSTFACTLDNSTPMDCTSPKGYTSLPNGSHTFTVRATDAAGNPDPSPATATWMVNVPQTDTTPPDTTITSAGPTGTVTTASASFTFTSTETNSSFECNLDGVGFTSCSSPASYSGLANSSHTFSVRAIDTSGNTDLSPATRAWTVNVPPPAPVNTVVPAISGTTSQGSMLTASTGTWNNAPTGYAYQWRRCDAAGATCADILNATGTGYLTTATDVGNTIRVNVTASNAGGQSTATSAATAKIAAAAADPVIAAAGDIACDPHDTNFRAGAGTSSSCRQKATGALFGSLGNLSAILTLGDLQYDCGPVNEYAQSFDPAWGAYKSLIRPAAGNHEYRVNPDAFGLNDCSTTGAGYHSYFGAAAGTAGKGYYSYDIGTWHLIALNANCSFVSCSAGSAQETWLKADLAAHQNMCTLAYYHQSRFSSGGSGNLSAYSAWWTDLYNAGADVVLSAHDHDYERFAPQSPSQASDPARGIREFIVGTGGRSRSGFQTISANSQVRDSSSFGLLTLTLHPSGYDFKFVPEAGKTFTDSGSGTCHA